MIPVTQYVDKGEVENLRKLYNKQTSSTIPPGSTDQVWGELLQRFHDRCTTGAPACVVMSMLKKSRAPSDWKENRYEWLSSDDIDAVEKKLAKLFDDYYFVGCVPIDFDLKTEELSQCLVSALCSMKLPKLYKKGYRRIGIAINTDTHEGTGEHWTAVFCDIRPELEFPRMTYFDSYAFKPEPEIKRLMNRWAMQWDATGIHSKPMQLTYNSTRHQRKDSECGMYCIYFHINCLTEMPMNKRIPDDAVNQIRDLVFKMPANKKN